MVFHHLIFLCASLLIYQVFSDFSRIDTKFLQKMNAEPEGTIFNVIVEMKPFPNSQLENLLQGVEGTDRSVVILHVLEEETNATQYTLIQSLLKHSPPPMEMESLGISNYLFFRATRKLILQFARDNGKLAVENVQLVREEIRIPAPPYKHDEEYEQLDPPSDENWHIEHIGAKKWHESGYDGTGVIIGHIDSGVDHKHKEVHKSWLGNPYGWKDPAFDRDYPYHVTPHGTATLSLIVGETVGIAPGATWISCINRDRNGSLGEREANKCGKFLLCPDRNTSCVRAPKVINCSFGGPADDEGAFDFLAVIISKWLSADIIPVFAAGNSGTNGCATLEAPSDRKIVLSVGSIGMPGGVETLEPDSSRGPPTQRYEDFAFSIIKPDFVAPGWLVRVAEAEGGYGVHSGTSLATAVVTGAIALMLSRNEHMKYKQVEDVFRKFAKTKELKTVNDTGGICGGIEDDAIPNFKFGYGSIRLPDPSDEELGKVSVPPPIPPVLSKDLPSGLTTTTTKTTST